MWCHRFCQGRVYPFSEISTYKLSSLSPNSYYVGVNILLNDSFSISFLNVYAPFFVFLQRIAEPTPIPTLFFRSPEISLFWKTLIAITPLGLNKYFWPPWLQSTRLSHLLWPSSFQWSWHADFSPSLFACHLLCSFLSSHYSLLGGASGLGLL